MAFARGSGGRLGARPGVAVPGAMDARLPAVPVRAKAERPAQSSSVASFVLFST